MRVEADAATLARIVAAARVPSRVELELADGLPPGREALAAALGGLPWEAWLPAGLPWAVRTLGRTDELTDPRFASRLAKDAIVARHAAARTPAPPVDPARPVVLVALRLGRARAWVGLDLAGRSLHRRGAPTTTAAPLREDLAAGIAWLAGARADRPLFDPFCGSGALIAEAAAVALNVAPSRPLAELPLFRLRPFRALDPSPLADALARRRRTPASWMLGCDADAGMADAARRRVASAGLGGLVTIRHARASDALPDLERGPPGLLLTNPPWGRRHARGVAAAWDELAALVERAAGWRVAVLAADGAPVGRLRLAVQARRRLRVGTVAATLTVGRATPRR